MSINVFGDKSGYASFRSASAYLLMIEQSIFGTCIGPIGPSLGLMHQAKFLDPYPRPTLKYLINEYLCLLKYCNVELLALTRAKSSTLQ